MVKPKSRVSVVVLNWNGKDALKPCLDSLLAQSLKCTVFVVENGSKDGSLEYLKENYPGVRLIINRVNLGFAGGVNSGIREAMRDGFTYVALFNNDAIADKDWLKNLTKTMVEQPDTGIITCKLIDARNKYLDSTGECCSIWGLPYSRGRGEPVSTKYDLKTIIFGASGGASLYRVKMLEEIGLFDEDFFAYYEDVDISFRGQLAGWKVRYESQAIAYHQIGATSSKIKGFTTYQTVKNLPWLIVKDVPKSLVWTVLPRFLLAHFLFVLRAFTRGHGWSAVKGLYTSLQKLPKKLRERRLIQSRKKVDDTYIKQLLVHDLPPNAYNLRRLRSYWWHLTGKKES